MRTTTRLLGVSAAAAAVLAIGSPAFADSADNDGVNLLNDDNVSVLPVQLCGNDVAALGANLSVGSPEDTDCVNAPIDDH
ncbi:hypothetical protein IQ251_07505 [Saccharopolyspora sp. HNM0983]|uniref:Small secreted domain DUF320 n=1 Tax=Saccharopolyspora montiporae TaxID=2781240 RepID=A0A929BB09_9PSEU|nr:hypothetical protein [Saccharopolyspora sp. HNM0983]